MEKSSEVLHDEAIWKAVSRDKPVSKGKELHFSQPSRQEQQQQSKQSSGSSTSSSFWSSSLTWSSSKTSSSSSPQGKGKKFWMFLTSLAATGGKSSRSALACLAVLRCRFMDGSGSPAGIQGSFPSSPTCVAGTPGAAIQEKLRGPPDTEGGNLVSPVYILRLLSARCHPQALGHLFHYTCGGSPAGCVAR